MKHTLYGETGGSKRRKGALISGVCIGALLLIASCSTTQVSRVDSSTQVDLSGKWNDTDVRQVCETLIRDCLNSPRISDFIQKYAADHNGDMPTVMVGNFKNASSEHIDTTIISSMMRTAIINSGKLEFVEGGEARTELRAERYDQHDGNASEESISALGNETGATFLLQGTVKSMTDKAGDKSVRSYFVTASMSNVETTRVLWQGENTDIKKVIVQPGSKF